MTAILSLPLGRSHVMEQLERLLRVYKRPEHAPADPAEFATDYAQICGELTAAQFTGAVDAYLRGNTKWFPKPGELLTLGRLIARGPGGGAGGLAGDYDEWERSCWQDPVTGRWTPCPVCQATMAWQVVRVARDGQHIERLLVLHNAAMHWKAGVGFSMRAAPGTGGGKWEHVIVDERPQTVAAPPPPPPAPPPTEDALERQAIQAEDA